MPSTTTAPDRTSAPDGTTAPVEPASEATASEATASEAVVPAGAASAEALTGGAPPAEAAPVEAGAATPLAERIQENAEELAAPAAGACECQDTASLVSLPSLPLIGRVLSDRTLKCDVRPVVWGR